MTKIPTMTTTMTETMTIKPATLVVVRKELCVTSHTSLYQTDGAIGGGNRGGGGGGGFCNVNNDEPR